LERQRVEVVERARLAALAAQMAPENFSKPEIEELTDKHRTVIKLRAQNDNLKSELKMLSQKLEEFVQISRSKRSSDAPMANPGLPPTPSCPVIRAHPVVMTKERELRETQRKI